MAHQLRHIRSGVVYEAVRRARGGRYAVVPSAKMRAEPVGVIGEAQRRWPQVKIHQWCLLSTHFHALLSVIVRYGANALAAWMNFVFGESAKVAQALYGLEGEVWEKLRCRLIPIEDDTKLLERVTYIMAQAPAAGLTACPRQWPGLNTCNALCRGARLRGYLGSAALRRQAVADKVAMVTIAPAREIHLSPLPTHADWTEYDRQRWYRQIEREIIEETAAARAQGKRAGKRYQSFEQQVTSDSAASDSADSGASAGGSLKRGKVRSTAKRANLLTLCSACQARQAEQLRLIELVAG